VQLSARQESILRGLVEEFVATGQPVGSKTLLERTGLHASPSTVRAELAELEALGLLTHPHTSAGRVPTEAGYRYYAAELLGRLEPQPAEFPLDLHTTRTEVEAALQATTEMLSQVTRLLALVSAPPLESTTVVHVEVLLLQPEVVMVVVITSAGGVTKRLFHFEEPVDSGLAQWANEYLNETVAGLQLGTSLLRRRFADPGLRPRERAFLEALRPAFTELVSAAQRLYVGGAADLLGEVRGNEPGRCLDALLCAALIEARSHERLALLAEGFAATDESALASVVVEDGVSAAGGAVPGARRGAGEGSGRRPPRGRP